MAKESQMALAGLMLSWARPIGRLGGSLPCPVYSLKGEPGGTFRVRMEAQLPESQAAETV